MSDFGRLNGSWDGGAVQRGRLNADVAQSRRRGNGNLSASNPRLAYSGDGQSPLGNTPQTSSNPSHFHLSGESVPTAAANGTSSSSSSCPWWLGGKRGRKQQQHLYYNSRLRQRRFLGIFLIVLFLLSILAFLAVQLLNIKSDTLLFGYMPNNASSSSQTTASPTDPLHKQNTQDAEEGADIGGHSSAYQRVLRELKSRDPTYSRSLLDIEFLPNTRLYTLKELMEQSQYPLAEKTSGKVYKVCDALPGNVTVDLEDPFKIGVVREFRGGMYDPVHCWRWARWKEVGHQLRSGPRRAAFNTDPEMGSDAEVDSMMMATGNVSEQDDVDVNENNGAKNVDPAAKLKLMRRSQRLIEESVHNLENGFPNGSPKADNTAAIEMFEEGLDVEKLRKRYCVPRSREDGRRGFSEKDGDDGGGDGFNEVRVEYAFVMMVSNHRYVDGAIVLAESIRQHSRLNQEGIAEIVLLITDNIAEELYPVLRATFDRIVVTNSFQKLAPKSYYKTTFDKMYLFYLTEYKSVLFMDADSMARRSVDHLVVTPYRVSQFLKAAKEDISKADAVPPWQELRNTIPFKRKDWDSWVTGIRTGERGGPPVIYAIGTPTYFQSGLMFLEPNLNTFIDLYLEFRYSPFDYNQWRARDGLLFRNCLLQHYQGIYVHTLPDIFHFFGRVKPWFNVEEIDDSVYQQFVQRMEELPSAPSAQTKKLDLTKVMRSLNPKKEGDTEEKDLPIAETAAAVVGYEWWTRYESLHRHNFADIAMAQKHIYKEREQETLNTLHDTFWKRGWKKKKGGVAAEDVAYYGGTVLIRKATPKLPLPLGFGSNMSDLAYASPHDYMWLQRYSKDVQYLKPTRQRLGTLYDHKALKTLVKPLQPGVEVHSEEERYVVLVGDIADTPLAVKLKRSLHDATNRNVVGKNKWKNCDAVCAAQNRSGIPYICDEISMLHSQMNRCTPLSAAQAHALEPEPGVKIIPVEINTPSASSIGFNRVRCDACVPIRGDASAPFLGWRRKSNAAADEAADGVDDVEEGDGRRQDRLETVCYYSAWARLGAPRCNSAPPPSSFSERDKLLGYAPLCICVANPA